MAFKIAVIGAGAVGLSTACCLAESLTFCEVTIIADQFQESTVSYGAAGYFRPEPNGFPTFDQARLVYQTSWNYYTSLARSGDPGQTGVTFVTGYSISRRSDSSAACNPILESICPNVHRLSSDELSLLFPDQFRSGYSFTTCIIDPRRYLPYLTQKFHSLGGLIKVHTVTSLTDDPVLETFDLIVNCTGLCARQLANDHNVVPIRGQVIKVKAPWIKHCIYADGVYIYPGIDDHVTLGGIKSFGDGNTEISPHDRGFILSSACQIIPGLSNVPIAWEWVGLRPFRGYVRLETETVQINSGNEKRKIIHNYGHGAHGISLSWGCAVEATRLAIKMIPSSVIKVQSNL